MRSTNNRPNTMLTIIAILVIGISFLHYSTPTTNWQYHLIYMQAYFIPIILAAFQFGIRGGLGTALVVSAIYLPHIMMQWGGLVENNLMRFMQIILFNVLGYLTGLKAQGEKKEKEKYQKTARELERALVEQGRQSEQIREMEQQLRAADRLAIVGELTASLAHEVRNPLASIRGAVEIIRDAVPEETKKMEFFDILIQDTERLNRVVEHYLSFAKKSEKIVTQYDLAEVINNISLMIDTQARKKNIRIDKELEGSLPAVSGDPNQLWQVMMNLLLNAIQAIPDGDKKKEGVITIKAKTRDEKDISVSVLDNGCGIPSEDIEKVFKAFYTTKSSGTGLGLAIVKRICDENGWRIEVNSSPGEGTEVAFFVPLNHIED